MFLPPLVQLWKTVESDERITNLNYGKGVLLF